MHGYKEQGTGSSSLGEKDSFSIDFSSEYSDNFPKILQALGVSLVATSYQAHAIMLIRCKEGLLNCGVKKFIRPMGVTVSQDRLTLGTAYRVVDFKVSNQSHQSVKNGTLDNLNLLSRKLQDEQRDNEEFISLRAEQIGAIKQCDRLYSERASLTTGMINIHDIAWGSKGLWVVNTSFSCLATLTPEYGFIAHWRPHFISELKPEDRCHLNGMAMLEGKPRYVTTFNTGDSQDSWRTELNGTLMDVKTNQILLSGLSAPHSPRCHEGLVYFCDSGRGEVVSFDPQNNSKRVICALPGFTRGVIIFGDLVLVATSRMRSSDAVQRYPLAEQVKPEDTQCGIWIINKNSGEIISKLIFSGDINQIYDIAIIPDSTYPELMTGDDAISAHLFEFLRELGDEKV